MAAASRQARVTGDCKCDPGDGNRLGQDYKSLAMFVTVQLLVRIMLQGFPIFHPCQGSRLAAFIEACSFPPLLLF